MRTRRTAQLFPLPHLSRLCLGPKTLREEIGCDPQGSLLGVFAPLLVLILGPGRTVTTLLDYVGSRVARFQRSQYEEDWGETRRCSRLICALTWPKHRVQEWRWRLPFKQNSGWERGTG